MSTWNFADVWEAVADIRADEEAQVHGARRLTWRDLDVRADGIAGALLDAGLGHQAKVAQHLYNCPEYVESVFACFKAGLIPVNTNYRYTEDELVYLWANADVEAVVFCGSLTERVDAVRPHLPSIGLFLWVDDGSGPCPAWATSYEDAAASGSDRVVAPWGRSGDDLMFIYTGGTTGMPKGVMWRQDDLFAILNSSAEVRYEGDGDLELVRRGVVGPLKYPRPRLVPTPPLMHGSGLLTAFSVLSGGGTLVLLEGRSFDPVELLDVVEREAVTEVTIVGDAFAKPILRELDADPGRWDLSSLWMVISAGVVWSAEVKRGLLKHMPKLLMLDNLGSSEALTVGRAKFSADGDVGTASFQLGRNARVITDDGREVTPGSGEIGVVALRGRGPVGYYKDAEKSAATFRVMNGERWSVPGDHATVELDGSIKLLGRGAVCINTGGEKVFPEEVEEVLKQHPSVEDAVVVGIPDERFGEAVVGVVELLPGAPLAVDDLVAAAREHLAGYKVPKRIIEVATIGRAANGKVDYKHVRALAVERLG